MRCVEFGPQSPRSWKIGTREGPGKNLCDPPPHVFDRNLLLGSCSKPRKNAVPSPQTRVAENTEVTTIGQTINYDGAMVAPGRFAFGYEYRNPGLGGSLMKPVYIGSSVGLDRLATWNEVRRAIAASPQGILAVGDIRNDMPEVDSDFSASVCNLPEDDLWLAIVSEMPDSKSN